MGEKGRTSRAAASQITAMVIFGTIGLLRLYIGFSSAVIAMLRALIGGVCLVLFMLLSRKPFSFAAIKRNLGYLLPSGFFLGLNWVLLFEAYRYTSVATATLCYYMAPVFILLASPLVLHEKLTLKKIVCILLALGGMIPISGILGGASLGDKGLIGVGLGLAAAFGYMAVVLLNKKLKGLSAYETTASQLLIAFFILLVYTALDGELAAVPAAADTVGILLISVLGLIHTGLAYTLYFGSVPHLPAQTSAIFSYIDPVIAILLSALVLHEELGIAGAIGAVLILGSAILCECPVEKLFRKKS